SDVSAPALREVHIGQTRAASDGDIGYVGNFGEGVLTFSDTNRLVPEATKVQLFTEDQSPVPVSTHERALPGKHSGDYRITVRPDGELEPGRYTLSVTVTDGALNTSHHEISFNTIGIMIPVENMKIVGDSGRGSKPLGSLHTMFYRGQEPGDYVEYEFSTPPGEYEIWLRYTKYEAYGIFEVSLDGQQVGEPVDAYVNGLEPRGGMTNLGVHTLDDGPHRLHVRITGKNSDSGGYFTGLCDVILRPAQ
ncbi:MAG: hypothetical protein ACLFWB_09455, partial [Armatimonadota bacterium]